MMRRLFVTLALILTASLSTWAQTPSMTAHFIDIGQGESVLLEFNCGAMLIDAGAQDAAARTNLIAYLNKFFARRTDLHKTVNTVLITHDHIDHDFALRVVVENFTGRTLRGQRSDPVVQVHRIHQLLRYMMPNSDRTRGR